MFVQRKLQRIAAPMRGWLGIVLRLVELAGMIVLLTIFWNV
jgi:hypothetical protein